MSGGVEKNMLPSECGSRAVQGRPGGSGRWIERTRNRRQANWDDFAAARHEYEVALAVQEHALGPRHPELASTHNNLAAVCRTEGRYEDAARHLETAIDVHEKARGLEHPGTAMYLGAN